MCFVAIGKSCGPIIKQPLHCAPRSFHSPAASFRCSTIDSALSYYSPSNWQPSAFQQQAHWSIWHFHWLNVPTRSTHQGCCCWLQEFWCLYLYYSNVYYDCYSTASTNQSQKSSCSDLFVLLCFLWLGSCSFGIVLLSYLLWVYFIDSKFGFERIKSGCFGSNANCCYGVGIRWGYYWCDLNYVSFVYLVEPFPGMFYSQTKKSMPRFQALSVAAVLWCYRLEGILYDMALYLT